MPSNLQGAPGFHIGLADTPLLARQVVIIIAFMLLPCLLMALWRISGNKISSTWLHLLLLPAKLARLHLLLPTRHMLHSSLLLLVSSLAAALAVGRCLLLLPAAAAMLVHCGCERLAGGPSELRGYSQYGDFLSRRVLAALCQVGIKHGHTSWHDAGTTRSLHSIFILDSAACPAFT